MQITTTPLAGAALVNLKLLEDDRGFFARTFCRQEFVDAGLDPHVEQCNVSFNHKAGTLRGMHYQADAGAGDQAGALHRAARSTTSSSTCGRTRPPTCSTSASSSPPRTARRCSCRAIFAHGYITLDRRRRGASTRSATAYAPGSERGLRWDDPGARHRLAAPRSP